MTEVRCTMNARGGFIESDAPYLVESPGTGAGVMLTLDSSIQRACEAVGIEMVDKGCIVVLDAPTGRVRASVSLPLYDPENVASSRCWPRRRWSRESARRRRMNARDPSRWAAMFTAAPMGGATGR